MKLCGVVKPTFDTIRFNSVRHFRPGNVMVRGIALIDLCKFIFSFFFKLQKLSTLSECDTSYHNISRSKIIRMQGGFPIENGRKNYHIKVGLKSTLKSIKVAR